MESIENYLKTHSVEFKTLYYPGAGADYSPMELLYENTDIQNVVYSDYNECYSDNDNSLIKRGILPQNYFFKQFNAKCFLLNPTDYKKSSWSEFWWPSVNSTEFSNPIHAWGTRMKLKNQVTKRELDFTYLGTEGAQTAAVLHENEVFPDVLVLQDHGTGGNWSSFGLISIEEQNEPPLYQALVKNLPKYLLAETGGSTNIWPGYKQVTLPYVIPENMLKPQHNNERALYKKIEQ